MNKPNTSFGRSRLDAAQSLAPPKLDTNPPVTVIDDTLMDAYTAGLPFRIPPYDDMTAGDQITLVMNGHIIDYHLVLTNEAGRPIDMIVAPTAFNFTGKARLYYRADDVTTQNPSFSLPADYIVMRRDFPNPDENRNSVLLAPEPKPSLYNASNLRANTDLLVTVPLVTTPGSTLVFKEGDVIDLHFELRASTLDQIEAIPPLFYPVSVPSHTLTSDEVQNKTLTIVIPSASLAGIDENVGRIYYSLYQDEEKLFELQSRRAPIQLDVVPPRG